MLSSSTVTQDESNRTWGRSSLFRPEEFDDVKKGIKKKGRTWGPSSVQTKERPATAERWTYPTRRRPVKEAALRWSRPLSVCRVRPLSDGSNPWSTSLVKSQKSVPLAALFAEQGEFSVYPDAFSRRRPSFLDYKSTFLDSLAGWCGNSHP